MEEIWKDIDGYDGLYQVSNLGRVRRGSRLLRQSNAGKGYLSVTLSLDGHVKRVYVHRLVAMAFIPNPSVSPCVNHKDETRTNNTVDNLEWCTYAYNNTYGTCKTREAVTKSKPVEQLKGGVVVRRWSSGTEAGRWGYSQTSVSECCSGKRKTHKGYEWRFAT